MNADFPLPGTWDWASLGDLSSEIDYGLNEEADENGEGVPFLRISDIDDDGRLLSGPRKRLTIRGSVVERLLLHPGDILIARSGSIGRSFLVSEGESGWAFASYLIRFRVKTEVVVPTYLAAVLRSVLFRSYVARVGRSVAQPNINSKELARFRVPLPTLVEQHRIIQLLRQAEVIAFRRGNFAEQTQRILHAALDHVLFLDGRHDYEELGSLAETRYGTSVSADSDEKSGVPVLRIPNVVTGEVNTTNIKYVALSAPEVDRLQLRYGDVLVVRSNGNPNYVGRTAPVTNFLASGEYVYASYLIRLRLNTERLRPEYVSCYFNSPYGRAALRNAIRTTAGQSNVSGESLSRLKIPIPPIGQQLLLADVWNSLESLRTLILNAEQLGQFLRQDMTLDAFSGMLTEDWRARNYPELQNADRDRRFALGGNTKHAGAEKEPPQRPKDLDRPARTWLLNQLSEFQQSVRVALHKWKDTVTPDDTETFDDFCLQGPIEHEQNAKDRVRRSLEQLASFGLIAKVSLRNVSGNFVNGYRPLREDEDTRLIDAQRLQSRLGMPSSDQETEGL